MPTQAYDIITVGGGIAASAFGRAMTQRGARVLILEKETRFRDRGRHCLSNRAWGHACRSSER